MSFKLHRVNTLLLTGMPGVGKTTLMRKVVKALSGWKIQGFLTDEIRVAGCRQGFRLNTFDGHSAILAHTDIQSKFRVGKYGVDIQSLDRIVDTSLQLKDDIQLYVIDEIGKMECFSKSFMVAMTRLLDSGLTVVATIHQRAGGFVNQVKQREDVELWSVTYQNRDDMVERILVWITVRQPSESG
ncbi:MAG: NTPase [Chloroflexota bacterium]